MTNYQITMCAWALSGAGLALVAFIIGRTLLIWHREVESTRNRHAMRWRVRWFWWLPTNDELHEPGLTTFKTRVRTRRQWLVYVSRASAQYRVYQRYGR